MITEAGRRKEKWCFRYNTDRSIYTARDSAKTKESHVLFVFYSSVHFSETAHKILNLKLMSLKDYI